MSDGQQPGASTSRFCSTSAAHPPLVWTLVGATVFASGWAMLAPLPETVAVQGKLQPSSPVQDIDAPSRCGGSRADR